MELSPDPLRRQEPFADGDDYQDGGKAAGGFHGTGGCSAVPSRALPTKAGSSQPPVSIRHRLLRRGVHALLRACPAVAADFLYQQIKGVCRDIGGLDEKVCVVLRDGGRMVLDLKDGQQRHVYYCGFYERRFMACLSRYVTEGSVFVDVGASVGFYTVWAARRVGAAGHIHSIEPNPRALRRLRRNVALNALTNVTLHNVALSDRSGSGYLVPSFEDLAKSRLAGPAERGDDLLAVPVRTLETCLNETGSGRGRRVDVVKIDAEGAETAILQGALPLLTGAAAPCLLVEVDDRLLRRMGSSERELLAFLHGLGYRPFHVTTTGGLRAYRASEKRRGNHNLVFLPAEGSAAG
jgi:FkbM family methyltransferase